MRRSKGSTEELFLGSAASLEGPEQRGGSQWGDLEVMYVQLVCLLQPQSSRQPTWHPDARLSAHSSTQFPAVSLDPDARGHLTDLKVTLLFWGIQVWAQAELITWQTL